MSCRSNHASLNSLGLLSCGTPIFPDFFSFAFFFPYCFCCLLLLLLLLFASAFAFCFWPFLLHLLSLFFCFLLFLLLFLLLFASAFAFADYLLCIDTATKLDDKTFTLSFDTQLHQSRNEAAQRCLYLICIQGEALGPPPPPLPLCFKIVATTVHHPYYFQYLYHLDHPATSLTTVTTTTVFFALMLPQRWISTLLSPKNPKPLKPKDNRRKVPIIVPLSSYFSFVKWDAFSGRTPKETLKTRNRTQRNPKPVKLKTTAKKSLVSGIPFLFPPFVTVTLALVLRPLPFLLLLVLVKHSQQKQKQKQ